MTDDKAVIDARAEIDLAELDLPVLISVAARLVNERILSRLRYEGFTGVRESDGFLIQHLIAGPQTPTVLAARLSVSQQAASKRVREIEDRGYVERVPHPTDRRQALTRLTARGELLVARTREIRAELEGEFVALGVGASAVRAGLVAIVDAVDPMRSYANRRIVAGD